MKMSVYVDDNATGGPDKRELEKELADILAQAPGRPGRRIDTGEVVDEQGTAWISMDFPGSDVFYSRGARSVTISVGSYIRKMCKRFGLAVVRPVWSPNFDESKLLEGKTVKDFPVRSVVGALQWIATTARPDVAVPVCTLAKYTAETPTMAIVKASKKVARYLLTTQDEGAKYSPEFGRQFSQICSELLPEGRDVPKVHLFSGASFASTNKGRQSAHTQQQKQSMWPLLTPSS